MHRWSFEEVFDFFAREGCQLLEKKYIKAKAPLNYICECGKRAIICFDKFKCGQRCRKCRYAKTAASMRRTQKEVSLFFESNGCILLEDYKNAHSPLCFQCHCGEISKISFNNFKYRKQCGMCGLQQRSGENHYKWNSDLSDEDRGRDTQIMKMWRNLVFSRDKFKCVICMEQGIINAHHLDGYDLHVEKRTDPDNGVTLCEECHKDFHKIYGLGKNTKQQFEEYVRTRRTKKN